MNQDFKEFFKSLNARGVEFLVVGGVAYNFYAPPRATKDIDVWIRPTIEWADCWSRRVKSDYAGEPIAFLAIDDLLASKLAAGRDQDLVDAKKLRAIADRKRT